VRLPPGERVYAIGDIHGLSRALDALLARIDRDLAERPADRVTEVFLGDYIDRGPDSRGVVERLLTDPPPGRARVCLMGNHEDAMLRALATPEAIPRWLAFGGEATLASYGVTPLRTPAATHERAVAAVPEAHRRFLAGLPRRHRIGDLLLVHAGIRPGIALADQDEEDLIWIREEFLDFPGPLPLHVVHGHTPAPAPERKPWRTNVDTGAVYGGRLTAAAFEGDSVRFLSVPGAA
jgi:serine/threonine protein phosphatase 1